MNQNVDVLNFFIKTEQEQEQVCMHSEHDLQEVVLDLQMNGNPRCGTEVVKTAVILRFCPILNP